MKSFKISFLLLFSFVLITSTACAGWNCKEGKEKPTTEKRNLENFSAIEMNIQGDIKLVVVNENAPKTVEINTNADLIQYITTEIKDGKLIIDSDPCIDPDGDLIFTLTVSNLEKITINGSGDVEAEKLETVDADVNKTKIVEAWTTDGGATIFLKYLGEFA